MQGARGKEVHADTGLNVRGGITKQGVKVNRGLRIQG